MIIEIFIGEAVSGGSQPDVAPDEEGNSPSAKRRSSAGDFPDVKSLRVFCTTLYSAQTHQREQGVPAKPVLVALGLEVPTHVAHFLPSQAFTQWNEEIGRSEIAIILGNFVFQDEMISESIPRQIG